MLLEHLILMMKQGAISNHLLIFDSLLSLKEKESEKFQTHLKNLGPALPADVSQILLPGTKYLLKVAYSFKQ